jgi:hypothetical protein
VIGPWADDLNFSGFIPCTQRPVVFQLTGGTVAAASIRRAGRCHFGPTKGTGAPHTSFNQLLVKRRPDATYLILQLCGLVVVLILHCSRLVRHQLSQLSAD